MFGLRVGVRADVEGTLIMGGSLFPLLWKVVAGGSGPPATYTISGSVVDGNAAALAGVTITLSGDADDTTTTSGDGSWSFTDMSDGSYTVTPSKTNFTYTPSSADASVSGDNKVVSAFVITFPIYLDFESDTIDQNPADWIISEGAATILVKAIAVDSNGYTPAGYTKMLNCSDAVNWRIRVGYDLQVKYGLNIPTQFKIQALIKRHNSTDNTEMFTYQTTPTLSTDAFLYYLDIESTGNYQGADFDGASTFTSWGTAAHSGTATDLARWSFLEMGYRTDTSPNKMELGVVTDETDSLNGPRGLNEDAGYTQLTYATPAFGSQQGAGFGSMDVARMWIGNYSDTFPTS